MVYSFFPNVLIISVLARPRPNKSLCVIFFTHIKFHKLMATIDAFLKECLFEQNGIQVPAQSNIKGFHWLSG